MDICLNDGFVLLDIVVVGKGLSVAGQRVSILLQRCNSGNHNPVKNRVTSSEPTGGIGIDTNIEVSSTTWEAHHSPRTPEGGEAQGLWWASQVFKETTMTKMRYQLLFHRDETKLMMNKQILSIYMLKIAPKLSPGYSMVTSWCHWTWLFLFGNTCSNHCDVTVGFVTLNSNCTFNQNRQQNMLYYYLETGQY